MLSRIEQFLFYLLLFSIPFQTRKILYYEGWRFNEWLSVSVYWTDLLFLALLIFWLFNNYSRLSKYVLRSTYYGRNFKSAIRNPNFYLVAFLIISAISIKNSGHYSISSYNWLKLAGFAVFYWYLSRYAFAKFGLFNSFLTIMMAGLFQAYIAIVQYLKQSSIGLKYLGESLINGDLLGIASFYLPNGEKVIRAYGTTPHPNVLASFLLLALFAFYFVYLYSRLHEEKDEVRGWDKIILVFYGVILFAFFATFSRTVIFIWFVSFSFQSVIIWILGHYQLVFVAKDVKKRITAVLLASFCVIVLFGSLYYNEIFSRLFIEKGDQSIELRTFYNEEALKVGGGINLFGVGIGDFVGWLIEQHPYLSYYVYQPVHNIYLLIYSETGFLGISAFLLFLLSIVRNSLKKFPITSYQLLIAFCLLFIGLFDHLFWTLQQGRLIFWFSLAVLTFIKKDDRM